MIANYHTHTWRCNHASGTEEEYVRSAISAGMKILGFSDHTPYLFPDGYYSTFRMRPEALSDYSRTVLDLQKQYRKEIEIHLGVECEYYPNHFSDVLELLREHEVEYLILGQHFTGNEYDSAYGGKVTDRDSQLRLYCSQSMEAMNTGLFTYFAHPDLIHYIGDAKFYKDQMRHVCREANSCGIPLELNLLGIREKRWYPNRLFLETAAEENCRIILGVDAHDAKCLNDPATEEIALSFVREYGLKLLDSVPLRSIL